MIPFVTAGDQLVNVNTNTTFFSDFMVNNLLTNISAANISFYDSNLTLVSYGPMYNNHNGSFSYNFSSNVTGTYYRVTTYYNSTNTYQSSDSFTIVNNINSIADDTSNIMSVPLLIGLSLMMLIGFFTFVGYKLQRKPLDETKQDEWQEPRFYLGFQFYNFAVLFLLILFFILMQMAVNLPYFAIVKTIFIIIMITFGSIMLLLSFMTIPMLITAIIKSMKNV